MQDFHKTSMNIFGGDVITVKIKDGCRRPYLLMEMNHFRADTTRPLVEHLSQDFKNLIGGLGEDMITRLLQC